MTDNGNKQLFSTNEAAEYLGMTQRGIEYHVYRAKDLKPDEVLGHSFIFKRETLDALQALRVASRDRRAQVRQERLAAELVKKQAKDRAKNPVPEPPAS